MKKMKKHFGIIILLLFSVLLTETKAQQKTYTLEEAIQVALENNPDVRIAQMDITKANAAVSEAFGYALPIVDVSANFSHFLETPKMPFPDFEALLTNSVYATLFKENVIPEDNSKFLPMENILQSFTPANNFQATAQLTQIIFNSTVFQGIGASQIYLELSEFALKAKKSKIILDVTKAFNQVLVTRETYEIMSARLLNAQENLDMLSSLHKEGLASDFDKMQAEVQVENIKPVLMEIQDGLSAAIDGLKMTIGLDPNTEIEIRGELKFEVSDIPTFERAFEEALDNNHDLNTFKQKQRVDYALIEIDRSEYWPTIAAFGSYSYNGTADDFDFMTYNQALVGLSFSMNLFQGNRTSRKVQQSKIAYDQTTIQINQMEDAIKVQLRIIINELNRVKSSIHVQSRNVELAQKTYDLAVINFKEGTGTQLQIKNADVELSTAKLNRLSTIFQYISAKAEFDHLMGKLIN